MRHERIEAHNAIGFMYLIFLEAGVGIEPGRRS
jgi:hypothetical protein